MYDDRDERDVDAIHIDYRKPADPIPVPQVPMRHTDPPPKKRNRRTKAKDLIKSAFEPGGLYIHKRQPDPNAKDLTPALKTAGSHIVKGVPVGGASAVAGLAIKGVVGGGKFGLKTGLKYGPALVKTGIRVGKRVHQVTERTNNFEQVYFGDPAGNAAKIHSYSSGFYDAMK
uniref:Uncharacterized protein n=1 Tax=viral metagenome TaxID=1070528 RepID=A0A2V0RAJ2_9ZZZZ